MNDKKLKKNLLKNLRNLFLGGSKRFI